MGRRRRSRDRGRLVPAENLHVTLAFLGHRPGGRGAGDPRRASRRLGCRPAGRAAAAPLPRDAERGNDRARRRRRRRDRPRGRPPGAARARSASTAGRAGRGCRTSPFSAVRNGEESVPELANRCSIHVVRSALYRSSLAAGGATVRRTRNGSPRRYVDRWIANRHSTRCSGRSSASSARAPS